MPSTSMGIFLSRNLVFMGSNLLDISSGLKSQFHHFPENRCHGPIWNSLLSTVESGFPWSDYRIKRVPNNRRLRSGDTRELAEPSLTSIAKWPRLFAVTALLRCQQQLPLIVPLDHAPYLRLEIRNSTCQKTTLVLTNQTSSIRDCKEGRSNSLAHLTFHSSLLMERWAVS